MRKMLFTILLLVVFGLLAAQTPLLEDNFTGTVGTLLTANGWTAHSGAAATPLSIASPGLSYPGYPSSGIGEATSASGTGEDVNKAFTPVNSGSLYYSFLVNTAITSTTAGYSVHFNQANTIFLGKFWLQLVSGSAKFGLSKSSSTPTYDTANYALGTTYLVVVKYTFNTGSATDDAVYMWVNPTLGSTEPTPNVAITTEITTDAASLSAISIRQWSTGTLARFDGIRVGTSWVDIAGGGAITPTITVTPAALNGFTYIVGAGPSAPAQSFNISGVNFGVNNISIAASTDYEISETLGSGYTTPIVLTPIGGIVTAKTIYVRLKAGLVVGDYNAELITATSTGATPKTVTCSGTVAPTIPTPVITLSAANLSAFNTYVGTPSAFQSYTVAGVNLTDNIAIAAVDGYAYCLTSGGVYTSTLSLAHLSGSVATTTIYVHLTGVTLGAYNGVIAHTSAGAAQQDKAVTGSVINPVGPSTFLEENFSLDVAEVLTANTWNPTGTPPSTTNLVTVSTGNLSYPGCYPPVGNYVTLATSGQDVNRTFSPQFSDAVYASFLINFTSAQTGDYFFHFGQTAMASAFFGRVFVKRDGTTDNAFIGLVYGSGTGLTTTYTPTSYAYGSTILLVLKYQIVDGALNDVVELFVNPSPAAPEPTPTLTSTNVATANPDATTIGSIGLRQGGAGSSPVLTVDGIRVTNTWSLLWPVAAPLVAPAVTITWSGTNIVLNWADVAGANSYRVESSNDPYTGYASVATTVLPTWSGASEGKKFFKVIALP